MGDSISDYITVRELAATWEITPRRLSKLCSEGRIDGAVIKGKSWLVPKDAKKPSDARTVESQLGIKVKPFVKWAGGKSQVLDDISRIYPSELGKSIKKYAEPFIGGDAVLFDVLSRYDIEEAYISDINRELIGTYQSIKSDYDELIDLLRILQHDYDTMEEEDRKDYFYNKRTRFNKLKHIETDEHRVELASLFIFLNKTCFNGLYRVNGSGNFNVPSGRYKNPLICDESNLKKISEKLQKVKIVCGDYKESIEFIDANTFVYFDPPYRPLTQTASFTAYTELLFNDENQTELAEYVSKLSNIGAKIVVSNSDPKNINESDEFFDNLYSEFDISRISATRAINSKGTGRGKIKELLIKNY